MMDLAQSETRQSSLYEAIITTYILAFIAVSLRFYSRRLKKAGWWLDDWMILIALVSIPLPAPRSQKT